LIRDIHAQHGIIKVVLVAIFGGGIFEFGRNVSTVIRGAMSFED
jgi:hypothetical protein